MTWHCKTSSIWAASWQNQQNGLCVQRRLRSAWASAQFDQSLPCPHEESLAPKLPTKYTAKTLIRLGRCSGWSESSLGTQSFCWFCHEAAHLYRLDWEDRALQKRLCGIQIMFGFPYKYASQTSVVLFGPFYPKIYSRWFSQLKKNKQKNYTQTHLLNPWVGNGKQTIY